MLSRLSIKQKLILIVLIPLVIVVLLATKLSLDSFNNLRNLQSLDKLVVLSVKIGNLVHETQKERAMSSGFLGSNGEKFKTELPIQRVVVDEKSKELNLFLASFDKNAYSLEFSQSLDSGLKKLEELNNIRNGVNSLSLSASVAIGYYTDTHTLLINTIGTITKLSQNAQISQQLTSYMNFLLAKERTGVERAVGTNTFAKNSFAEGMKAKFYTLVAEQNAYIDSFLKVSSLEIVEFYKKTFQGESISEVEKMRKIALFSGIDSDFKIDPNYWFKQITEKINILKEIENHIVENLDETINNEVSEASQNMIVFGLLSVFGISFYAFSTNNS
jgi:methyl-accepting chemotaxis protein